MGRWVLLCFLVCACSARLGNHTGDGGKQIDSPGSGSDGGDGGFPAWSTPQWVQAAGGSNEYIDNETLSSDQLELYFALLEGSGAYKQLYVMTRQTVADAWGMPTALGAGINAPAVGSGTVPTEESPRLAPGDLTLYWGHNGSIYSAQRANEQTAWSVVGAVTQVNVIGEYQKWMAVCDNNYFMLSRSNGSAYDLYEGQLGGTSGSGAIVTELNIGSNQLSTFLSQDCMTTYFASDASGSTQIYTATRSSPTSTWTTPTMVQTFDAATTDKDPWLSNDQLTFYYASTQFAAPNAGNRAIYFSTR